MQRCRMLLRAATAAAVAATCSAAAAANVEVTETLDLAQVSISGTGFLVADAPAFAPGPTFSLAVGDTLSLTIDFAGSQTLTISGPTFIWAYVYANTVNSDVSQTGTMSFLDAAGHVLASSSAKTDIEGAAHVGQQFLSDSFAGLPPQLTFYRLRYDGTLDAYLEPGVTTRTYTTPVLDLRAVSVAVPEPATFALMLGGLGLLVAAARRRSSVSVNA